MEVISASTYETKKIAYKLAEGIKAGDVILLYGDLGSGKTTFTRYLAEALGVTARVQSPTFVLVRKYAGTVFTLFHVDLYRLNNKSEVNELGLMDLKSEEATVIIVEWPELIEQDFDNAIKVHFEYIDVDKRKILVQEN